MLEVSDPLVCSWSRRRENWKESPISTGPTPLLYRGRHSLRTKVLSRATSWLVAGTEVGPSTFGPAVILKVCFGEALSADDQ